MELKNIQGIEDATRFGRWEMFLIGSSLIFIVICEVTTLSKGNVIFSGVIPSDIFTSLNLEGFSFMYRYCIITATL